MREISKMQQHLFIKDEPNGSIKLNIRNNAAFEITVDVRKLL